MLTWKALEGPRSRAKPLTQINNHQLTEADLVDLRRTIYQTFTSSATFDEAGHKLLQLKLTSLDQQMETCRMLIRCCSSERTYNCYYGLLGQRFCAIHEVYRQNFARCFSEQYADTHCLDTSQIRNIANFFAHLLATDNLGWRVLGCVRRTMEDTTMLSRIFLKILFQELGEHVGIRALRERLSDASVQPVFSCAMFAVNFFESIGLGAVAEGLMRERLARLLG